QTEAGRRLLGGDHDRARAVIHTRGIPGGDRSIRPEWRGELGQLLERRVGARMLVAGDRNRLALSLRNFDRDQLRFEEPALVRRRRALLTAQRELVLVLAADREVRRDVLTGLGHG